MFSEESEETVSEVLETSNNVTNSGAMVSTDEEHDIVLVADTEEYAVDDEHVVQTVVKEGFVKRWTRKVVSWVKKVFRWGSRKSD